VKKISLLAIFLILVHPFNAQATQEIEVESLKKTNQDLKIENQILQAENHLLRKLIHNSIIKLKLHDLAHL
jgi:regulator of replication initiation timing